MNKSVLISIQPKWCKQIADGSKMVEIRKTKPSISTPFKCYIYKSKNGSTNTIEQTINNLGKVIGEFVCDDLFTIGANACGHEYIEKDSCLSHRELENYQGERTYIWGWHISDLVIYDKPKELSEFGLKRPPQSWCYVEEIK